jgi:ABC-2 type transport system ATP-binding protein
VSSRPLGGTSPAPNPAAEYASPAIMTLDLSKRFGSTTALAGLSLTVGRGEVFGFLGPNGAGKTTAVKLLVGLSSPTSGEAWVLDAPIGEIETRRRIGYLPELFRYQDWLSGREVLQLQCRLARIPKPRRTAEVDRALEVSGLTGRGDDRVGTYSKGMQQRLGLGAALLGDPAVVFLDEPTSALDPVGRHDVREIIRSLKSRGVTVFLNSHLLTEVEQVCDRVAVVDNGRTIATGTLDELRGGVRGIRIKARGIGRDAMTSLSGFGEVIDEGTSVLVHGVGEDMVPEVVRMLVSKRVDIFSVQSAGTLEESFLSLLEENEHDHHGLGRPDTA